MKQTALEWLLENINLEPYSEEEFKYNSDCWDKALAMEKEQIIDGITQYQINHNNIYSESGILNVVNKAEQYYNKTFKSE